MSDDVLITPTSRKIELKDNSGNVDGKIELDANGNLNITSPGGDIGIGDPTADVYIGDGTNNVDVVFEQNGEIRALTGRTLTLGQSDSNVHVTAQNFTADQLELISSNADANEGPVLSLYRDSASPADNDIIGAVKFQGENDAAQKTVYAEINTQVADASDITEDARLQFRVLSSGSMQTVAQAKFGYFAIIQDLVLNRALREAAYECTGTYLDPSNGTLQYKTLSANTTFTEGFSDGEAITLMIDAGSGYTITWPTITWVAGTPPTLATSGYTTIVLWHRDVLYGAVVG